MSIIYSFLQKRKMHENQHGIIMVITAYVLSFIMLVLGSDVFYNINSAAAGINMDTYEETQELPKDEIRSAEIPELQTAEITTQVAPSQLINPYGIKETTDTDLVEANAKSNTQSKDTNWLLGSAMDGVEYETIMGQLDNFNSISVVLQEADTITKDSEEVIESLATQEIVDTAVMSATKEEITMLERIVEAEASGEDMVGKILVANVIFNRMADEEFPDTVEGVIFQEDNGDYQFSPVSDERYWSVKVSDETKEAVVRALEGEDYSEGALYFIARKRTKASSAKWFDQHLDWLFKHGGHEFYKNK